MKKLSHLQLGPTIPARQRLSWDGELESTLPFAATSTREGGRSLDLGVGGSTTIVEESETHADNFYHQESPDDNIIQSKFGGATTSAR